MNTSTRIGSGRTEPGNTNWTPYLGHSTREIEVQIVTSAAKFTQTPHYVSSLCAHTDHWAVCGSSAIYDPTPTGFRLLLRYSWNKPTGHEQPPLTPADANSWKWHINWIGIEA